jgi:2-keto-4-pentenoate hydratase
MTVERGMHALLELRRERIARGERPIGWKAGFGSAEARQRLGLSGPLVGFLPESGRLDDGAQCSLSGWKNPLLEAEIAVHMGRDVVGAAQLEDAIAGLGVAIELVDMDPPATDPERVLAGNVFHRHVLLGPVDTTRRSPAGVSARLVRDGTEVAATDEPEAINGTVLGNLRHIAETVAAAGERLRAGDVVIAGAVVAAQPVAAGESWLVELPPLGSLTVGFR